MTEFAAPEERSAVLGITACKAVLCKNVKGKKRNINAVELIKLRVLSRSSGAKNLSFIQSLKIYNARFSVILNGMIPLGAIISCAGSAASTVVEPQKGQRPDN